MSEYLWRCDLKNWIILRITDDKYREYIQGEVVIDHKGRFNPGDFVYSQEINKKSVIGRISMRMINGGMSKLTGILTITRLVLAKSSTSIKFRPI